MRGHTHDVCDGDHPVPISVEGSPVVGRTWVVIRIAVAGGETPPSDYGLDVGNAYLAIAVQVGTRGTAGRHARLTVARGKGRRLRRVGRHGLGLCRLRGRGRRACGQQAGLQVGDRGDRGALLLVGIARSNAAAASHAALE
ncbi:MAG: hypothetical protein ACE5LU_18050 [Anaerolineae bacterium]